MPNRRPGEEEQIKNPRRDEDIDEIGAAGQDEDADEFDEDDEFQDDEESEEDEDVDEEDVE